MQGTVSALEDRTTNNYVTTTLKPTSVPPSFDGNDTVDEPLCNSQKTIKTCSNEEGVYLTEKDKVNRTLKMEPKDIDEQMTVEEDIVMIKEELMEVEVVVTKQECEEEKDNFVPQEQKEPIKELKTAVLNQTEGNQMSAPDTDTKASDELLKPRRKYTKKKNKDDKNHVCDNCAMKFSCKAYLLRHMRIHTGEKPYACNSCDKTFAQNGHLIQHMRLHTGEKPYVCHICKNKAFNHRYNYKTHMRKHFGVPSHTCDMCDSAFHQKGDLKRHIMSHTGEKPYTCNTCSMKFAQNCHLTKHMKLHTREQPACPYCGLKFEQKIDLNNHLTTHAGKLFPCPIKGCYKSFTKKGMLTNHIQSHTEERPFACDKCDRTFKQKGHLTKHTILSHDNMKHEKQNQNKIPLNQGDLQLIRDELKLKDDVGPNVLLQNQDDFLQNQEHVEEYIIP